VWSSERHGAQDINCPLRRVSEASMPAAPSGTEVIPHDAGTFGGGSQGRGLSSAECRQIRPVADAFVLVTGLQGCLEPWKL